MFPETLLRAQRVRSQTRKMLAEADRVMLIRVLLQGPTNPGKIVGHSNETMKHAIVASQDGILNALMG